MVYNGDFLMVTQETLMDLWENRYLSGAGFINFRRNLQNPLHTVWTEVRTAVAQFEPDVVGIYCCAPNMASAAVVARIVKEINSKIIVVIGGPHPTAIGKEAMQDSNIDVIVKGEGEQTIVELLKNIGISEKLKSVDGIIYRERALTKDQIAETPDREPVRDLDSLSFPIKHAREVLKDYEKYPLSAFHDILATRGCSHNCVFCGVRTVNKKPRLRSVENVAEEIRYLQRMGIKEFDFRDDCFGVNKTYLRQLLISLIRNCPGIRWRCETRVDLIDKKTAALMKKAGCIEIRMGVESGNDQMLKEMRKGITIKQAISAAKIVKKHGIELKSNFMIGMPTETVQTLKDTVRAMEKIDGKINYAIFTPYPGTEAFEYCKKAGLIPNNYDASLYNQQSPENCFCVNFGKRQFRNIATEIETYIDRRNKIQDLKHRLSLGIIQDLAWNGAFDNEKSLLNFVKQFINKRKL